MKKIFALLLVMALAGCAAPACRPVAYNPPPAAAVPPPAAPVPAPAPAPAPASNEPGYLHASGGAFY